MKPFLNILLFLITAGTPSLAVHLLQVISPEEFIGRRLTHPEVELSLFRLPPDSQPHIQFWLNRLQNRSLQVLGPCRLRGQIDTDPSHECMAPTYPLFPYPDEYRNKLLGRPPPDIVRQHVEMATAGKLSTVRDLVDKLNTYLQLGVDKLTGLSDNELMLLATNFAVPEAGLSIQVGCGPVNYGPAVEGWWSEDLLVSQDEQRALVAGFLYVIGNDHFIKRREEELEEAMRVAELGEEKGGFGKKEENGKEKDFVCESRVLSGANLFVHRVEQLNKEVIIAEGDWMDRYNEYLAALRAELFGMVPTSAVEKWGWDKFQPSVEEVVSTAEDVAHEKIDETIPLDEPGFRGYLADNGYAISSDWPGLDVALQARIVYRRWKSLSDKEQAVYMR